MAIILLIVIIGFAWLCFKPISKKIIQTCRPDGVQLELIGVSEPYKDVFNKNFSVIKNTHYNLVNSKINGFAKSITSIKSIDLDAKSYQQGNNLYNTIMGYAKELAGFQGARHNGINVTVNANTQRGLVIGIPHNPTPAQKSQIDKAINDAKAMGVSITIEVI